MNITRNFQDYSMSRSRDAMIAQTWKPLSYGKNECLRQKNAHVVNL